jgi:hypothetical protein
MNGCRKTAYNDHVCNQNLAETGNHNAVCEGGNADWQRSDARRNSSRQGASQWIEQAITTRSARSGRTGMGPDSQVRLRSLLTVLLEIYPN